MLIQVCLMMLLFSDPNNVGYTYTWHQASITPTPEVQERLTMRIWESGYIPKWYRLQYPGADPNTWFRWERCVLPTAIEWLMGPSDVNHDRKVNLRDYGIVAEYHPGGLVSKPEPPPPTKLEVLAEFMSMVFMENVQ